MHPSPLPTIIPACFRFLPTQHLSPLFLTSPLELPTILLSLFYPLEIHLTSFPSNLLRSVPLNHSHHLSFHLLNARNLRTKFSRFLDYIVDHQPDIVAITETWFKLRDAAARAECTPWGYMFLDHPRYTPRQGGGTAILYRDIMTVKCNSSGELSSFEFSDWSLCSKDIRLRIIFIHIPPFSKNHSIPVTTILEQLSYLEPIIICNEPLIISGDFNIHVDIPSESLQFSELFQSMSLIQHVNVSTHEKGHTLDFVTTSSSDNIIFSDHFSLSCSPSLDKPSTACLPT